MNKLIVIGWMGIKKCYLNIPKEEAIERFCKENELTENDLNKYDLINEYVFKDEFDAYDAWA